MKSTLPNERQYFDTILGKIKNLEGGDLADAISFLNEKPEIVKVLDVGCGMAEPLILRLSPRIRYSGIDPSQYCIESLIKKFPNHTFKVGFADELPFEDLSFDAVISNAVVQMFDAPRASLDEMMRVVCFGGHLIILCPNFELPWSRVSATNHYTRAKKIFFYLQRCYDLMKHFFGILTFRTISQNYVEATGGFNTYKDEDAKYVVSGYEIATYLKRGGFVEIFNQPHSKKATVIKKLALKIPALKYAGAGIFMIYKKKQSPN